MAIITNNSKTVECHIKNKFVTFADGICTIPNSKIEHIISECGDVDLESLIAFNGDDMDDHNDGSKPCRVVFAG